MCRLLAGSALFVALLGAALGVALPGLALGAPEAFVTLWGVDRYVLAALAVASGLAGQLTYVVLGLILVDTSRSQSR